MEICWEAAIFAAVTLANLKQEIAKLSAEDQEALIGFLHCRAVMRDPQWQEAVQSSTARHSQRTDELETSRVAETAPS